MLTDEDIMKPLKTSLAFEFDLVNNPIFDGPLCANVFVGLELPLRRGFRNYIPERG